MSNLKVGDRVKIVCDDDLDEDFVKGEVAKIVDIDSEDENDYCPIKIEKLDGSDYNWVNYGDVVKHTGALPKPPKPVQMKYILQYELDEDPFELFATLPEVKARIRELAKDSSLKRDRIYVYEIKKTTKVEISTTTNIKGL